MANESDVRQRVGKFLRSEGFMVQAMETGAIADGVPDLWYSKAVAPYRDSPVPQALLGRGSSRSGWLELKKIRKIPVNPGTSLFRSMNHPLGVYQVNWITACIEAGTPASILVAYERRYFFVPGRHADDFNNFTWADLQKFEIKLADLPRYL